MTTKIRIRTAGVAVTAMLCIAAQADELPDFASDLSAGTIAVISDGDFVAESYANGRLAPREAGNQDVLTVVSMKDGKVTVGSLPVSNSVTAAPEILALTPDGSTAFVTERLGQRSPTAEMVRGRELIASQLVAGFGRDQLDQLSGSLDAIAQRLHEMVNTDRPPTDATA